MFFKDRLDFYGFIITRKNLMGLFLLLCCFVCGDGVVGVLGGGLDTTIRGLDLRVRLYHLLLS